MFPLVIMLNVCMKVERGVLMSRIRNALLVKNFGIPKVSQSIFLHARSCRRKVNQTDIKPAIRVRVIRENAVTDSVNKVMSC